MSTGLAYLFYNLGLEKVDADNSSIIILVLNPIVAIILGIVIIGEAINYMVLAGGAILIIARIILKCTQKI